MALTADDADDTDVELGSTPASGVGFGALAETFFSFNH
jgi:hypothetical protein